MHPKHIAVLFLMVAGFFVALFSILNMGGPPEVDQLNSEVSCQNAIKSDLAQAAGKPVTIPEKCFDEDGEPVIESLEGAEPGDQIEPTVDGYQVVSTGKTLDFDN